MSTILRGIAVHPFYFVMPFLAKSAASDWDSAVARLMHSVRNVIDQHGKKIYVMVCLNDVPDQLAALASTTDRIILEQAPLGGPSIGAHKGIRQLDMLYKQKHCFVQIGRVVEGPAHVMLLDADDLIRSDFVKTVRAQSSEKSAVINGGYVVDFLSRTISEHDNLSEVCGSTSVFYMETTDYPDSVMDGAIGGATKGSPKLFLQYGGHRSWGKALERSGRSFISVADRVLAYVKNNGSNLTSLRQDGTIRRTTTIVELDGQVPFDDFQDQKVFAAFNLL